VLLTALAQDTNAIALAAAALAINFFKSRDDLQPR